MDSGKSPLFSMFNVDSYVLGLVSIKAFIGLRTFSVLKLTGYFYNDLLDVKSSRKI